MGASVERQVSLRWRDTDALGHVNHAVFLTYLEVGRDAFYEEIFGSDPIYVVARIELDFLAEVMHTDGHVTVRVEAEKLGTTSLTTLETMKTAAGKLAARARVVTVRWNDDQHKAIPFGPDERARLQLRPQ